MTSSVLNAVLQAKRAAEADLLRRPGVGAVDVGYKLVGGRRTPVLAIRVLVAHKRDVPAPQRIPLILGGVRTDVIQRTYVPHRASLPALAPGRRPDAGYYDPIGSGISIGPCRSVAGRVHVGTLGAAVRDRATGAPMLLSSFHVLAVDGTWRAGDAVVQPGRIDGGACPGGAIGTLQRALLGGAVDAAVALQIARGRSGEVVDLGPISGTAPVTLGTAVRKRGRSTGLTFGAVESLDLTLVIDYGPALGRVTLSDQIGIEADARRNPRFGASGDSGSLIVDAAARAAGLYTAGTDDGVHAVANPIQAVLDALDVRLEAPSAVWPAWWPAFTPGKETTVVGKRPEKPQPEKLDKFPFKEKFEKAEKRELKELKVEQKELKQEKLEQKEGKGEIKETKLELKEVQVEKPLRDLVLEKAFDIPVGPIELQPGFANVLQPQAGVSGVADVAIKKPENEKINVKSENEKLTIKPENEKLSVKPEIEKLTIKPEKPEKFEKIEQKELKREKLEKPEKPEKFEKREQKEFKEFIDDKINIKSEKEFNPEKIQKDKDAFEKLQLETLPQEKLTDVPGQLGQVVQPFAGATTDLSAIKGVEKAPEKRLEKGPEKSPEKQLEKAAEKQGEKVAEKLPEKPVDKAPEKQLEKAAEKQGEKVAEKLPEKQLEKVPDKIDVKLEKEGKLEKLEKFEKLEKNEKAEKLEKPEKPEKLEKNEKAEKPEIKEVAPEKLQVEVATDKLSDAGPGGPGPVQQPLGASGPGAAQPEPPPTLEGRVAALEAQLAQLLHFIPADQRPDLSQGALSGEPGSEPAEPPPSPAPAAGETPAEGTSGARETRRPGRSGGRSTEGSQGGT